MAGQLSVVGRGVCDMGNLKYLSFLFVCLFISNHSANAKECYEVSFYGQIPFSRIASAAATCVRNGDSRGYKILHHGYLKKYDEVKRYGNAIVGEIVKRPRRDLIPLVISTFGAANFKNRRTSPGLWPMTSILLKVLKTKKGF